MGLGMGADFSGFDSWSCWEGAIDEETAGGDGQFWHYFWHGERQLFHNPWLIIDKRATASRTSQPRRSCSRTRAGRWAT